jgi:hypothetical protein
MTTRTNWAQLGAHITEVERLIRQYPGRRQVAKAPLSAAAIYEARAARPAALPKHRAALCRASCHQATNGFAVCEETSACKNLIGDAPERRLTR